MGSFAEVIATALLLLVSLNSAMFDVVSSVESVTSFSEVSVALIESVVSGNTAFCLVILLFSEALTSCVGVSLLSSSAAINVLSMASNCGSC